MNKNIEYYVKGYQLFSEEECKEIIKNIEDISWEQHLFYDVQTGKTLTKSGDKELDVGYFDYSSEIVKNVMRKIWTAYFNYVSDLNFDWFNAWNGYSQVRFNRYKETRQMAEHCDHIQTLFDGVKKGIPMMTALGLLNEDYEGGEFVMWGDTVIPFKAGEIKVFPSNFLYPHRIDPVTNGIRYSFVSWAY